MGFDEKLVQSVWEKGRVAPDQDPDVWRKDQCGAWIKRPFYGDRSSEFGWEIDYITPGGPAEPANLRVLQWENYLAGGVGRAVCKVTADPGGIRNKHTAKG